MNPVKLRRSTLLKGLLVLPLVFGASLVEDIADPRPPCIRSQEWTSGLHTALPGTLNELRGYPRAYWRAIVGAGSPEVKARLYRNHYSAVASRHDLTSAQKALIDQIERLTTPSLYSDQRHKERMADLQRRAPDVLGQELMSELSLNSPNEAMPTGWHAIRLRIVEALRSTSVLHAKGSAWTTCDCNQLNPNFDCNVNFEDCIPWECTPVDACGLSGMDSCTGLCQER